MKCKKLFQVSNTLGTPMTAYHSNTLNSKGGCILSSHYTSSYITVATHLRCLATALLGSKGVMEMTYEIPVMVPSFKRLSLGTFIVCLIYSKHCT